MQKRSPPYAGRIALSSVLPYAPFRFTVPVLELSSAQGTLFFREVTRMTESTFPQYPLFSPSAKGEKNLYPPPHPWSLSGAASTPEGKANLGETIDIVDHQGKAVVSTRRPSASQIRARLDI